MFKDCGEIIECRVLKDKTSTHNRGVSFIQFANKKQCDLALLKDGTFLDGQEKPLIVKFAQDYKKKNDGKGFKNGKYQYRGL